MSRRALALLALTACGRVGFDARSDGGGASDAPGDALVLPPPPPAFVDGARLRMGLWHAGAATLPATWFDTQLGIDCSFRPAADGVLRCLPTEPLVQRYADAACTTPLALAITSTLSCGAAAAFAVEQGTDAVGSSTRRPTRCASRRPRGRSTRRPTCRSRARASASPRPARRPRR